MVVRPFGSTDSPLDNVTVSVLCWIYCSGKDTDRQKPTVAHKTIKNLVYYVRNEKGKIPITVFIPKDI